MQITNTPIEPELRKQLISHSYGVIGCIHHVHSDLGPGLPEYIYQEALTKHLRKSGYIDTEKEYRHFPTFEGETLETFVKMDLMVPGEKGNIVIECKSLTSLTTKERYQIYGYLRATQFPIGILVNFGTWPKAQVERYHFDNKTQTIRAF